MNVKTQAWYDRYYAKSSERSHTPSLSPWYELILEALEHDRLERRGELLELGCGRGTLFAELLARGHDASALHGIEQSAVAVDAARALVSDARVGNIVEPLPYGDSSMRAVILAEVIEHLEDPSSTLAEIERVLAPGGRFYLTFPNYLNLPWLLKRVAAQVFRKPDWIVLQPIDKIYTFHRLRRRIERSGLVFERVTGSIYLPPGLMRMETPALRRRLDALELSTLSFHPLLVFTKA